MYSLPFSSTTYFIRISYGIQQKMTDDLYSYMLFARKNSLLRIGKHKRCSLSIYHTSFDPHQLHYSIATHTLVKRKKEILFDLKTSVCYLSLVFPRSSFYSAQICKNASAILNGVSFEIKIRFKRQSNDFKGNCMNSFYPIYIL